MKLILVVVFSLSYLICISQIKSQKTQEVDKQVDSLALILYSKDIATLQVINEGVNRKNLNQAEKDVYLEHFNNDLGDILGHLKSFIELKKRLKANFKNYEKYIIFGAKVKAAGILYEQSQQKIKKLESEQ